MKTIIHPNKEVLVQFPNGQLRYRNCQSTVMPEDNSIKNPFPANRDLRIQAVLQSIRRNSFRDKIDNEVRRNGINITWLEIIIGLLAVLLTFICMHL